MASYKKEIRNLIAEGKKKGYVTYEEMNHILPRDLSSPDKIDSILMVMDDLGLEVLGEAEAENRVQAKKRRELDLERKATRKIDDPVRMYLTQMGEIPLLSRDEEIAIAKEIDVTRMRFRKNILSSELGQAEGQGILKKVSMGKLAFGR